jgi:hypothetical protein
VVSVPFARPVLDIATNPLHEWVPILVLSLTPVTLVELSKLIAAAFRSRSGVGHPG